MTWRHNQYQPIDDIVYRGFRVLFSNEQGVYFSLVHNRLSESTPLSPWVRERYATGMVGNPGALVDNLGDVRRSSHPFFV